jgi:transposase
VDRHGFPLEIGCWEGNKAEKTTMMPIIRQFQARHHIEHMVIAADAGMLSEANLTALNDEGFFFIVGSRQTKAPIDLESHFHWNGEVFTDGQIIDTLTPRHGVNRDNDTSQRAEPVWDKTTYPTSWRAVWQYSHKRYLHDVLTLNKQEEHARAVAEGRKTARRPRFITDTGDHLVVNEQALQRAKDLRGLKGYVSNLPVTLMSAEEIIKHYHDEWNVEQSFRMSKHDLRARPMFQHRRQAIEAHLTISFTALAIAREIQKRTGLSIRVVLHELRPLRSALIEANGHRQEFPPKINQTAQKIRNNLMH